MAPWHLHPGASRVGRESSDRGALPLRSRCGVRGRRCPGHRRRGRRPRGPAPGGGGRPVGRGPRRLGLGRRAALRWIWPRREPAGRAPPRRRRHTPRPRVPPGSLLVVERGAGRRRSRVLPPAGFPGSDLGLDPHVGPSPAEPRRARARGTLRPPRSSEPGRTGAQRPWGRPRRDGQASPRDAGLPADPGREADPPGRRRGSAAPAHRAHPAVGGRPRWPQSPGHGERCRLAPLVPGVRSLHSSLCT